MKHIITVLSLCVAFASWAQKGEVNGIIKNKAGDGLGFATVTLLFPEDSTLAYFDITDGSGIFEIKDVKLGDYVLQAAFLGHGTTYKQVSLTNDNKILALPPITLEDKSTELGVVEIEGEAVPFLIKKDTIEYNSAAFRTKTNATVEDLLKKLPGVEVDKDGAIKAQGESVQKVLVDGKEFFSNDPKLATKNIPADAIKKIQVYDKKSEASEFTGIDDGEREKTINLMLKDDRKNGAFGELTAGAGTDERYVASGKISRFTEKSQAMLLGNVNNINDYGLSFGDFISFSGGPQVLRSGGGNFRSGNVPLNSGNQQGQLNSGIGGLTYSYEFSKNNTISGNYLFSKSTRSLKENSDFIQYTPNSEFSTLSDDNTRTENENHGANIFWRNEIDSITKLTLRASISAGNTSESSSSFSESLDSADNFANNSLSNAFSTGSSPSATLNGQIVRKLNSKKGRNIKLDVNANVNDNQNTNDWDNRFNSVGFTQPIFANQLWRTENIGNGFGVKASYNEPLGKNYYLEPEVNYDLDNLSYRREDFDQLNENPDVINTLSRDVNIFEPGINIKKTSGVSSLTFGVKQHFGSQTVSLVGSSPQADINKKITRLLPSLSFRKKFGKSNFLRARINSDVNYPSTSNLFPIANSQNLNYINVGNTDLSPEYTHTASLGVVFYDQFTFSSLNAFIQGGYTENYITNSKTIGANFAQISQTINYKDAYNATASINYNRPIKKYGIVLDFSFVEAYNRNYTLVNDEENILTSYVHNGKFSIGNKKKKVIDAKLGIGLTYSDSRYSLQDNLDNVYITTNYFGDIEWYITDTWTFSTALDYNIYDSQSFGDKQRVPLLTAEISHNFLKGDKGTLKLSAFDLLNQYNGVNRFAYQNSIGETRSNVLGQYFLLSFTYKLNKLAAESNKSKGSFRH